MKYIIIKLWQEKIIREIPVIFPELLVHSDMAEYTMHMILMNEKNITNMEIVSAGFCTLGNIQCFGKSESLSIRSRGKEDMNLIDTYSYMHGIVK